MSFPPTTSNTLDHHSSPSSSGRSLHPDNCLHARRAPINIGDRLANARNLAPSKARLSLAPCSVSSNGGGVPLLPATYPPIADFAHFGHIEPRRDIFQGLDAGPNYGDTRNYSSCPNERVDRQARDRPMSSSNNVEDRENKINITSETFKVIENKRSEVSDDYDCTVNLPRHAITSGQSPLGVDGKVKAPVDTMGKVMIHQAPEGAVARFLFLGPFRLVRLECAEKRDSVPIMKEFGDWLDSKMHEHLNQVSSQDEILPSVVYSISIPMTDEDWLNYNQALVHFPKAHHLHNLLSFGQKNFDEVTRVHMDAEGNPTWSQLTVPGMTLGMIIASLVRRHRLATGPILKLSLWHCIPNRKNLQDLWNPKYTTRWATALDAACVSARLHIRSNSVCLTDTIRLCDLPSRSWLFQKRFNPPYSRLTQVIRASDNTCVKVEDSDEEGNDAPSTSSKPPNKTTRWIK
ncbi:hypothetical protein GQ44DRAFT_722495 [Phaeosphaeriaceae sp. PMI808]|nr:hypothetical protein GQ44DRAFT_722495 [Phaeosphaeriaceae sp. PMI808]